MAQVILTAALRDRAQGPGADGAPLEASGDSVAAVLEDLLRQQPALRGWILDEQEQLRQHVNVFVNEDRADLQTAVGSSDQVWVIPAISGGSDSAPASSSGNVELLVGTKKGLFVLTGSRGGALGIAVRQFAGQEVPYAMRDQRSGRYFASVVHGQFGPHLFWSDRLEGEWQECSGPAFPKATETALERVWKVAAGERPGQLWAGAAPAALFESRDDGLSWSLNEALWNVPGRSEWEGGLGGLAMHSICPWPGEPQRLSVGISAAGVWHTDDGGQSWSRAGKGLISRYLPEGAQDDASDQCVHNLHRSPAQPSTLYMQFHGGVYRSDDSGQHWIDIGTEGGLPADFGFPLVADPREPDRAWVIPLNSDEDRVTADGRVSVYETRDRGESWQARSQGLPEHPAYLTVLRQAFCHDGGDPLGLYFGATSGDLFASADAGQSWMEAAGRLPPVLSVRSG